MAKTEFYVTVEPRFSTHGTLLSISATGLTKRRPERRTRSGSISVKLSLDIPDGAFLPLRPEAVIVVPEGMTRVEPIVVEAQDPNA